MEIKEAQKAKITLEETLLIHINRFEQEADLHVEQVDLEQIQGIGDRLPQTRSVKVQVEL